MDINQYLSKPLGRDDVENISECVFNVNALSESCVKNINRERMCVGWCCIFINVG